MRTDISTPLKSIRASRIGSPFDTGAFVPPAADWKWQEAEQFGYPIEQTGNGLAIRIPLNPKDVVVGLGQHVGPVNCRGHIFRLFSTDNHVHIPSSRALYGVYPSFMVLGERSFAVFVDTPAEVVVDAGRSGKEEILIKVSSTDFYFVHIEGESPSDLYRSYIELTGKPFIPPRWAFGYHQSRWSYASAEEVLEIGDKLREHDIPCDVVHLDIHYMDGYRVFTADKNRFPDLPDLSARMREKGIRLISIIDPGVKCDPEYDVYKEGKENGYFCERADGAGDFVAAVWAGPSVFPDFFRPEVRRWWGEKYSFLYDSGMSGFWNDMNEPALFYTPEAFHRYADLLQEFRAKGNYDEKLTNALLSKGVGPNEVYYTEFSHYLNGKKTNHRDVHNLYGTMMTRSAADYLEGRFPGKRHFLLSRSSYPGMHRYAAIWTGDNHSWWEHLSLNIQMMISLNLSGMLFTGADVGGFGGDCSGELLVRWTQIGAFAPFFRNHAALWAARQEPWCFDDETLKLCREAIRLRYALMPFIYGEFIRSACLSRPFITGLFFDFPEALNRLNDDQFCVGSVLVVAPVVEAAAGGRSVWLPAGQWLKLAVSDEGFFGEEIMPGGDRWVPAGPGDIPAYLRKNAIIASQKAQSSTMEPLPDRYNLLAFVDDYAECVILLDDGESKYAEWKDYPKVYCSLQRKDGKVAFNCSFESCPPRRLTFKISAWSGNGSCERLEFQS